MGIFTRVCKRNRLEYKDLNENLSACAIQGNLTLTKECLSDFGYIKQSNFFKKIINHIIFFRNQIYFNESMVNIIFVKACQNGNLELVKYLIEDSELKVRPTEDYLNVRGFRWASSAGNLDLLRYLLDREESACDIHMSNDFLFRYACHSNNFDILNFLINEKGIARTEYIDDYLYKEPNLKVESMFAMRTLNAKLKSNLSNKLLEKKKVVKI